MARIAMTAENTTNQQEHSGGGSRPSRLLVRGLRLSYSNMTAPVIDNLSLAVDPGEFVTLVGTSGVGKSTLLRAVDGLFPIEDGEIELGEVKSEGNRRKRAFVFQDPRLLPWRRVSANVAYGLESLSLDADEVTRRTTEALRMVGLEEEVSERYPRQLSGGQRQRVGIARALAVEPGLLLMDEPFGSVDAITRRALQEELVQIWEERGCSVLFVTHDIEEAVYLSDRVLLLGGSPARVVQEYSVEVARPRRREDPELFRLAVEITSDLKRSSQSK